GVHIRFPWAGVRWHTVGKMGVPCRMVPDPNMVSFPSKTQMAWRGGPRSKGDQHLLHMLMQSHPQKLLHVCKRLSAAVSGTPIPKAYRWHLPR
ncbi:MAG: hypothetical protein WA728_31330, partial [Xanthobacteraceae bacterium]